MNDTTIDSGLDDFIDRWAASSGAERANFQLFASQLCRLLSVSEPHPAKEDSNLNDYTFERTVEFKEADGSTSSGRIDLYKRGCFVMEAKQSREKGRPKSVLVKGLPDLFIPDIEPRGKRSTARAWDQLMVAARRQAEEYARALPTSHGWPPFVLVCDVGHCIEVFADFSGQGKNYAQFPDRQSYRIYLDDLRNQHTREFLASVWNRPDTLDPSRASSKVTRSIAERLALVSKHLEERLVRPLTPAERPAQTEAIAIFLMRCLFCMFAEDVKLLPEGCFSRWLERAINNPSMFKNELSQLWQAMNQGGYASIAAGEVKRFNGHFFASAEVIELKKDEISELLSAAKADWRQVEPAIFGTLLEQALDEGERSKLGAHYTPRAYVERLVVVTIIEPLRRDWAEVQATAERFKVEAEALEQEAKEAGFKNQRKATIDKASEAKGKREAAIGSIRAFHSKLCNTRVLDPACGTGNFLYVSLELMKRLEGEVLEAMLELGGQEGLSWMANETVDPHQFLGLETNPRAKEIAELVIWLGYLQWHFRTKVTAPPEPILHDFQNVQRRDAVMNWDGHPNPTTSVVAGRRVDSYLSPTPAAWPEADFIVGNPPFIGGSVMRETLGGAYAEALWSVHPRINDSADFVMYWWDRAAQLLTAKNTRLRRFGFVTTNSITQVFSRKVVSAHLEAKRPISILMAIPDHPWRKKPKRLSGQTIDPNERHAAVRVAFTVVGAGLSDGVLREVITEAKLDTDNPEIELSTAVGRINSDLTIGADVTASTELLSNAGLSSPGVKLHGSGFIVTKQIADQLGVGRRLGLNDFVKPYRNGRDLMAAPRNVMIVDFNGLDAAAVRQRFPEAYQHLVGTVKAARQLQYDRSPTKDALDYLERWWTLGKPRLELRAAIDGLDRYIATVETSKHRVFQFLDAKILPDNMLVCVALADAYHLGVLSSRIHTTWALRAGGWLGVGNDPRYSKSRCFDPFPFPDCSDDTKAKIRALAEELDAHRKAQQSLHPRLTLTQIYNVLEMLRKKLPLDAEATRIKQEGVVLVLLELHEQIDALVCEAYGWSPKISDEEILQKLVELNQARYLEERGGKIRWLRPEYQSVSQTGKRKPAGSATELRSTPAAEEALLQKPRFPTGEELAETAAIFRLLATANRPLSIAEIARQFAQGRSIERRVSVTIQALARLGHLQSLTGDTFSIRSAN